MIQAAKNIRVGQNAALRGEEKRIAAGTWRELLDMVGGHGVQQARAVLACQLDFAARGKVQPCRAGPKCSIAVHGSESQRRYAEIAITISPLMIMPVSQRLRLASEASGSVYKIATAKMCKTNKNLMPNHM